MKKAAISQPMKGKPGERIRAERKTAVERLESAGYEVIDTVYEDFDGTERNMPLKHLARSLDAMAGADLAYFMKGWEAARGCKIEHEACAAYGIKTAYEPGAAIPAGSVTVK